MNFLRKVFFSIILVFGLNCVIFAANKPENLCLYARLKAPAVSMPKIINFAKEVIDDPHFDAEMSIFASAFCHPTYEGLSKKKNVGVFFFYKPGEVIDCVIVAKFKKDSKLKNNFIANGLCIKDIDKWSFVSKNTEILDRLATADLKQITGVHLKADLEIHAMPKRVSENLNFDIVNQLFHSQNEQAIKRLRFAFSIIRDEIEDLRDISILANFDNDSTRLDVRIDANPGSEIGKWFSSGAGGKMGIPQCIFKTPPTISTFCNFDINSYKVFISNLWHKLLKNSDLIKIDVKIQQIIDDIDEFSKRANGEGAHYLFTGKIDEYGPTLWILSGSFDDTYVKRICYKILPNISSRWEDTPNTPIRYNDCNIFKIKNSDGATMYICAYRNNLIICDSEEIVKATVDNIISNRTKVSLSKGCAVVSTIDLQTLFNGFDPASLPPNFKDLTIKPFNYQAIFSKNRYNSSLRFDNNSLKNILKILLNIECNPKDTPPEKKVD